MRIIAFSLSLLAIALNLAMGFTGTVLVCAHATGDSHLVSVSDHALESVNVSCQDGQCSGLLCSENGMGCDDCVDREVDTGEVQSLVRSSGAERVVSPQIVVMEIVSVAFDFRSEETVLRRLPVSRAPFAFESLVLLQVKGTVLRV